MRMGNIGYTAVYDSSNPNTDPVIVSQLLPAPTTMTMPGMTHTANMTGPDPRSSMTSWDLLRPLPTIVDNQPEVIVQCNSFAEWVDKNPLLAGGLLLGLAYVVFKK